MAACWCDVHTRFKFVTITSLEADHLDLFGTRNDTIPNWALSFHLGLIQMILKNGRVPFFLTPNSWMLLINIFHTYVRLPEDNHGKPMKIGTDQHGPPAALREGSAQREGASQVQERPGGLRGVYHITLSHSMPCAQKQCTV